MDAEGLLDLLIRRAPDARAAGVREFEIKDGGIRAHLAPPDVEPTEVDDRPPADTDPMFDGDTFGRSKVPGSAQRRGEDDHDE